jgi:hypothetical protein
VIAVPLEVPLRTLAPNRLVWIQRGGLVYPYPARIVRDIANDLYVSSHEEFDPSELDCEIGVKIADLHMRGTNRQSLSALARTVWRRNGGEAAAFQVWWESLAQKSTPTDVGTAASFASRNVMTWSLFRHRYMIDTSSQSL